MATAGAVARLQKEYRDLLKAQTLLNALPAQLTGFLLLCTLPLMVAFRLLAYEQGC